MMARIEVVLVVLLASFLPRAVAVIADEPDVLPGTRALTEAGDLSAKMRAGFDRFLTREIDTSIERRGEFWQRDFTSREAYERSVAPNRDRFQKMIGAVDARVESEDVEVVSGTGNRGPVADAESFTVHAIRWPVLVGVDGEGLLLLPKGRPVASIVVIPDADQTPEQIAGLVSEFPRELQSARWLAEMGCRVVVPVLVDRSDDVSGNPAVAMTNQPHREWVYRQAFTMGRHIIGYEVQKVLAIVDWFTREPAESRGPMLVGGYAEGGLIAFYSAACDTRVDGVLVSGYFGSRQETWSEPIYRNVFGVLREFGDAEIASLIAPRPIVIEHREVPDVKGPPAARDGRRAVAAPGSLVTPSRASVEAEVARCLALFPDASPISPRLSVVFPDGDPSARPGEDGWRGLLIAAGAAPREPRREEPPTVQWQPSIRARQLRQVEELVAYNQRLLARSHNVRERFWERANPEAGTAKWPEQSASYRDYLWDEIVGRFPPASLPHDARTRKTHDRPRWTGYEVMLDVYPDVFCWGTLLVPKDLKPGERRAVVVCQHGLEGIPEDTITEDPKAPGFGPYQGFSSRLADRGFIVYAPHNFYRGGNEFRQLQRKAHTLKKTLFGLTTIQHQQHLAWLSELPFVDPERIGFYGLSYGGNTAVRVPALLTQYAVVISSGDFNEWITKNVTTEYVHSMIFHNVYEVFEWNLGHTFNHGDLAALIAPRPFMVERGHKDGVGIDEWVGGEYSRVRRLYDYLGIGDRTEIEFFNGPHTIHGVGTFSFLERHLQWRK